MPESISKEELFKKAGDHLDGNIFDQILEMDDDDNDEDKHEFSRSLVTGFFEQAKATFEQMEKAIKNKDLPELSSLGHFLKGSSATLGLDKLKNACECIQHLGAGMDEQGDRPIKEKSQSLPLIEKHLNDMKGDYQSIKRKLEDFYGITHNGAGEQ